LASRIRRIGRGGGTLGIYGVSCLCRFISDMAFLMNQK